MAVYAALALFAYAPIPSRAAAPEASNPGETATPPSVDEIVASWREREARVRTLDFTWRADKTRLGSIAGGMRARGGTAPPGYVAYEETIRLVLDGGTRGRYEEQGETWSTGEGKLVPSRKFFAFDGVTQTNFFAEGGVGFPDAHTGQGGDIARVVGNVSTLPIRLVYRPFDPKFGALGETGLEIDAEPEEYEGSTVWLLRYRDSRDKVVWVDPNKGMLPVRYFEFDSDTGAIRWQLDMTYIEDPEWGWIPSQWSLTWLGTNGAIRQSEKATVTEYRLNPPLDDAVFQVAIPAGTYVHDGSERPYILREDGAKRPVLRGEFTGDNYEELVATEPGERFARPNNFARWMLAINFALLVVIAILAVGFRLLRRRSA